MLKDKEVDMKISSSNYRIYNEKYGPFKKGDIIKVKMEDISKNSRVRVISICEICYDENEVYFQNYNKQLERGGYYCCVDCSKDKQKKTNLDRYGCEWGLQNKDIKKQSKETMITKYGVDNPSKIESIKKRRSKRLKSEEYQNMLKEGVVNKYGVDNVSKLEHIKKQKILTTNENYGVDNPSQCPEIFHKSQKSGKKIRKHDSGLWYRGSYEKDFLDFCVLNNIEVKKGITIQYIFENKGKHYHSDFFYQPLNLVIEIKSNYYYELYETKNKAKQTSTTKQGYEHIFIIDKNYDLFLEMVNRNI